MKINPVSGTVLLEKVSLGQSETSSGFVTLNEQSEETELLTGQVYALSNDYDGPLSIRDKVLYLAFSADPVEWVPSLDAVIEEDIVAQLNHA